MQHMNPQNIKGPSVAELQKYIRDKQQLEFLLINGDLVTGTLRWFDEHAFSLVAEDQKPITLLRGGVIRYRPAN